LRISSRSELCSSREREREKRQADICGRSGSGQNGRSVEASGAETNVSVAVKARR